MSFGDDIGKEFDHLKEVRLDRTVKSAVLNLRSDLIEASPVDTGELKGSWEQPEQISKRKWVIRNIAPHASVINDGLRKIPVNGKEREVGSPQLPYGFGPVIEITEKALQRTFNK